jgi:hypothetical protein
MAWFIGIDGQRGSGHLGASEEREETKTDQTAPV